MIKTIEEYFKQKTDNIYFIQLKEESQSKINGIEIPLDIPLPLRVSNLVKEIKDGNAVEELKFRYLVDGIIYLLGVEPNFKHKKEYLELLSSYDPNIEGYMLAEGIKKINDNQIEEGIIFLRSLINIDPENIRGIYSYGLGLESKAIDYYNKKDLNDGNVFFYESTKQFETILDIDPSFDLTYYKLGYHYRNTKQFKKAELIWKKFIHMTANEELIKEIELQLKAMEEDVQYEEGYNLVLTGKPNEGLEKLLPLTEKNGDWWNLLFITGLGYRQLGNYSEAIKYFKKVLILKPHQVDALNEIGLCYANIQKYDNAISSFSKALEIRPNDNEILCNRGMTYLQKGYMEKASLDIEKAFELNPEDEITIACKRELEKVKNGI